MLDDYRRRLAIGLTLFLLLFVALVFSTQASALSDTLGSFRAYTFTCTTTPQRLAPSSGVKSSKAMRVWNNSATSVFLGGSDVATTSTGYPICTNTTNCEMSALPIDAAPVVWCRVASGTVDVLVLAGN